MVDLDLLHCLQNIEGINEIYVGLVGGRSDARDGRLCHSMTHLK